MLPLPSFSQILPGLMALQSADACRVGAGAQHAGRPARLLVSHHPGGIDAFVKLPERPGLGAELGPTVVERYRVR